MSTWRDLRDLLEMYSAGGLVIMTGMDGAVMETAVLDAIHEFVGDAPQFDDITMMIVKRNI